MLHEGNLKCSKFKINELQLSVTQLRLEINDYKKKLELSTRIDHKKDNTIESMKQKLRTLRLEAKENKQALQVSLNRTAAYEVKKQS